MNYCRQFRAALPQLEAAADALEPHRLKELRIAAAIVRSPRLVRFALPDGGVLIEDHDLRALMEVDALRLPFPALALETFLPLDDRPATRRIIFAMEVRFGDDSWANDDGGAVAAILAPGPTRPSTHVLVQMVDLYVDGRPEGWTLNGMHLLRMREWCERKPDGRMHCVKIDGGTEPADVVDGSAVPWAVYTLLMFVDALACTNVSIERRPARPRSRAQIKANALPFDDYHVLVVDTAAARLGSSASAGVGGSHRSPRQHLRRGHIRRLHGSGRPIWVNAAVIGAAGGRVVKSYEVRAGAGGGT